MAPHKKQCRCDECEIERLRARLAEAERDARRYRWLRTHYLPIRPIERAHELPDGGWTFHSIAVYGPPFAWSGVSPDAAVDAAMERTP